MPPSPFSTIVKERRRTRDLTQERLAELVGCAVVTLKKIESGALRPSRQIAARLAEALVVPPEERAAFVALARGEAVAPSPTPTPASDDLTPARVVRGYTLRERIGAGGFGVVYRAYQPAVGRDVAIKVIAPLYADQPAFVRRFDSEAQLIARLEHPHIVPLYDYWRDAGSAYLVMRYIRGGTLQTALHQGPWALPALVRLIEQMGAALHTAHQHGVVHRDVKPANILLDASGNAYLADFGIAKDLDAGHTGTTQPSAVVGSPEYLSPEQLRYEPVTPQTDLYCLGVVLYELLTGHNPFANLSPAERLDRQLHRPLPALSAHRPGLPPALDDLVQRATAKQPSARYPDVPALVADFMRLAEPPGAYALGEARTATAAFAAAATVTSAQVPELPNPYRGLRAFQAADAALFFGRAALTERLLARLAEPAARSEDHSISGVERFLAVVGPSGSGKSSVVKAGLLPALRRGALPGAEHWFMTEAMPGAHPLEEIEAALLRVAINPPPSLLEQLRADERGLARAIKRVLPADEQVELLLVLDQFEELFTLVAHEDERLHVLRALLVALNDPRSRLRLVVTLRADFYDRPLLYPEWGELLRLRTEVVTPLHDRELEQAIVQPAARVGVAVEQALVAAITRDVAQQPGALPLVQYALTELFARREGVAMTLAHYGAIGGMSGALARRADALYESLNPNAQQVARQLFLRLVTPGEGSDDTRRRVRWSELGASDDGTTQIVLDPYGRYRLLTFDRDPHTGEATVEVAHEALIRVWGRLRSWLDESRAALLSLRRLAQAAAEWQQAGFDAGFLASGGRLAQFELLRDSSLALTSDEQQYLDASLAERDRTTQAERERQEQLRESLAYSEAQRLAVEALRIMQMGGNSEVAALLAIRSIRTRYTPQGDEAIATAAAKQDFALQRYEASGTNIAIAPDGRTFVVTGWGNDAPMLDVATGALLHLFAGGHTDSIDNVRFSPDGCFLATSGANSATQLWNVATGEPCITFRGHNGRIPGLAFSPDGHLLGTGGEDGTARLWNVASGEELRHFVGHTMVVMNVVFASNGRTVATASLDGTARLWDVTTGAELLRLAVPVGSILGVDIAPDGRTIATAGSDAMLRLWDAQTGAERYQCIGHSEALQRVVFSPDGALVASCGDDGTVRLWDVATGRQVRCFVGHTAFSFAVAFTPDGQLLVSVSGDGSARLWNVYPTPYLRSFAGTTARSAPTGQQVAVGSLDGCARLYDLTTGVLVQTCARHAGEVVGVAFVPNGKQLLTGGGDGVARVWDVETGRERLVLRGHSGGIRHLMASFDGRLLVTCGDDRLARLWDAHTGELLHTLAGHSDSIFDVAFSPDARLVATGSVDGTTRLWDVATGTQLRVLPGSAASLAFLADGATLVTGDWGGLLRLWDVTSGAELAAWNGHTTTIWDLRVSPDGRLLLSASGDRTARLWDLATRQELRRFSGHSAGVFSVDFSPDGRHILTGSSDGTVRLWDTDYNTTIAYLCGRLVRDLNDGERAQYGIMASDATCSAGGGIA